MPIVRTTLFVIFAFLALYGNAQPSVTVREGTLAGLDQGSTEAFLGVPFAAPPIGARRWQPPAPALPWRGVRPANRLAAQCAQLGVDRKVIGSEDCLYLNIWRPKRPRASGPLPVMAFIHGGGLMLGAATDPLYDGSHLAERGDVIVVTLPYRLAELGYLAHPALSAQTPYSGSGNYGLMDQMAGLRWIQNNISAFGGNPGLVTLMGESGGAASSCSLMASPLTRGLFHRVILESMSCPALPKAQAEREGMVRAFRAGCPGTGADTVDCLRRQPAQVILQTAPQEMISREDHRRSTAQLNVDGYTLPDLPLELVRSGRGQNVPLLLGSNADEGVFFIPIYATPTQLKAQTVQFYGTALSNLLYFLYPLSQYGTPQKQAEAIFADTLFNCRSRRLARAKSQGGSAPVFRYFYTYQAQLHGFTVPAVHGSELPFVFQNVEQVKGSPPSSEDSRMASLLLNYWTQFARTGDPNSPQLPLWEPYVPERDNYLVLNVRPTPQSHRQRLQCDLLDRLDPQ